MFGDYFSTKYLCLLAIFFLNILWFNSYNNMKFTSIQFPSSNSILFLILFLYTCGIFKVLLLTVKKEGKNKREGLYPYKS